LKLSKSNHKIENVHTFKIKAKKIRLNRHIPTKKMILEIPFMLDSDRLPLQAMKTYDQQKQNLNT
tara:strand:+ start:194109 stop:194303 length:195 start_codon:yes stop_codon:yes gene_type:complete